MKERPILFSGPMVRAIFDGRKTQTRRVARLTSAGYVKEPGGHRRWHPGDPDARFACPCGAPGDRLWVRETWGLYDTQPSDGPSGATVFYRATDENRRVLRYQLWRPSIHMPRWASRITLEVTGVRVERLQDITEEDAYSEGVDACTTVKTWLCVGRDGTTYEMFAEPDAETRAELHTWLPVAPVTYVTARREFSRFWDTINSKRAPWASNPLVWAVEFQPVDAGEQT